MQLTKNSLRATYKLISLDKYLIKVNEEETRKPLRSLFKYLHWLILNMQLLLVQFSQRFFVRDRTICSLKNKNVFSLLYNLHNIFHLFTDLVSPFI